MPETRSPDDKTIRIAIAETDDEKARVYSFRYQIYVEEQGKDNLSYADHSHRIIEDELDETGIQFFACEGEHLLATIRVNFGKDCPPSQQQIDIYGLSPFLEKFSVNDLSFTSRLMVTRDKRGSIILNSLLGFAYKYAILQGVRLDFCHCQPSLVQVYQHLGYRRYKENFVDPGTGYRVPMAGRFN